MSDRSESCMYSAVARLRDQVYTHTGLTVRPELSCTVGLRSLRLEIDASGRIHYHQLIADDWPDVDGFDVAGICDFDGRLVRLLDWLMTADEVTP